MNKEALQNKIRKALEKEGGAAGANGPLQVAPR